MAGDIVLEDFKPLLGDYNAACETPLIIAGPCSAESRDRVIDTARSLESYGVRYFRAGIWKPRTHPGSFEGVGSRGLRWLTEVSEKTGMVPITEVANSAHLRNALRAGLNAFWIGARTSANPFAVQELADILASLPAEKREAVTILVKNPVNPDLELWIGALQRFYAAGIRRLGAIHRGFSAYGEKFYRNRPEWRIPIELKRRIPMLPVICDPSHIAGRRDLVPKIARRAMEMNFDGLIIEVHDCPDEALSDSAQQISPSALGSLLSGLGKMKCDSCTAHLKAYREEIDNIDSELVALLSRRMNVAREIGALKHREGLSVVQPDRYRTLMENRVDEAEKLGLEPEFMRKFLSTIHDESVRLQLEASDKLR